jgi:hypothetical protein
LQVEGRGDLLDKGRQSGSDRNRDIGGSKRRSKATRQATSRFQVDDVPMAKQPLDGRYSGGAGVLLRRACV